MKLKLAFILGAFSQNCFSNQPGIEATIEKTATHLGLTEGISTEAEKKQLAKTIAEVLDPGTPLDAFRRLLLMFAAFPAPPEGKWMPMEKICAFWQELNANPPFSLKDNLDWKLFLQDNKAFIEKILYGKNPPAPGNCGKGYVEGIFIKGNKNQPKEKKVQIVVKEIDPSKKDSAPEIVNDQTTTKYYLGNPTPEDCPGGSVQTPKKKCFLMAFNLKEGKEKGKSFFEGFAREAVGFTNYMQFVDAEAKVGKGRGLLGHLWVDEQKHKDILAAARNNLEDFLKKNENVYKDKETLKKYQEKRNNYESAKSIFSNYNGYLISQKIREGYSQNKPVESLILELDREIHPADRSKNELLYEPVQGWNQEDYTFTKIGFYKTPDSGTLFISEGYWGWGNPNRRVRGVASPPATSE